jgi:hypothetical protein
MVVPRMRADSRGFDPGFAVSAAIGDDPRLNRSTVSRLELFEPLEPQGKGLG